ncbi:MAG TPA: ABC transporter substrate-binding protein [Allosphingosinicella sp.]|jgi:ABC-type nitrate/sulfonate/bicarbonate transport system substrate-binding protein
MTLATKQKKPSVWLLISLFVLALLAAAAIWIYRGGASGSGQQRPKLTVGYQVSPAMALIIIADDQHLFGSGTEVKLVNYEAGKLALQSFLAGSIDVAVAGDMPTGLALLQGQKLTAFTEVIKDSRDAIRMVVRDGHCDRSHPSRFFLDGTRRKIATSFGGGPHYFSYSFLRAAGVPMGEVDLVAYKPTEMVGALKSRAVDGIAVFDPAAAKAEKALGPESCTFPDPQIYREHYIAVAKPEVVKGSDPRLADFVAGLRKAETFIAAHPEQARKIVSDRTSIDAATMAALWPKLKFGVYLDPRLPDLWLQEVDFNRMQPGASFPVMPSLRDFQAAVSTRYVR